jgi:hypothetical protein
VLDGAELAVHDGVGAHDAAAERLGDRLMPQADAEDRADPGGGAHQLERDPGLVGIAGAGRDHDRARPHAQNLLDADRVVAPDHGLLPQLAQVVVEVVREAVVVIEQQQHRSPPKGFGSVRRGKPAN